jgi:hypothetical protein
VTLDLFAGLVVTDHDAAVGWYEQLLGGPPTFEAHPKESVWEVAEHRYLYVEEVPDRAGHCEVTLFVGDLDERLAAIADRGLQPESLETYDNGVRKATFRDPDGNEIGFGGAPLE